MPVCTVNSILRWIKRTWVKGKNQTAYGVCATNRQIINGQLYTKLMESQFYKGNSVFMCSYPEKLRILSDMIAFSQEGQVITNAEYTFKANFRSVGSFTIWFTGLNWGLCRSGASGICGRVYVAVPSLATSAKSRTIGWWIRLLIWVIRGIEFWINIKDHHKPPLWHH